MSSLTRLKRIFIYVLAFFGGLTAAAAWFGVFYLSDINIKPLIMLVPIVSLLVLAVQTYPYTARFDVFLVTVTLFSFLLYHALVYAHKLYLARDHIWKDHIITWHGLVHMYSPVQYVLHSFNAFDLLFLLLAFGVCIVLGQGQ